MAHEEQIDRIVKPNQYGIIHLPIAHYALINSSKEYKKYLKISIHGLGSCMAILLVDPIQHLHAMSHSLLPSSEIENISQIKYPHKFVKSSIEDLLDKLLQRGSKIKNLKAIIIGGATIFDNEFNYIGQQNIKIAREILNSLKIKIFFEDVGGRKGRTIIYNIKDHSILIETNKGTITKEIN
ncbi:MAG: chemotaxis protein CheD [Promethearchaeota archaeon]